MDANKDVPDGAKKEESKPPVEGNTVTPSNVAAPAAPAAPEPASQESKTETVTAPVEAAPAEAMPTEINPLETTPTEAKSAEPVGSGPVETASAATEPVKPASSEPAEATSAEAEPVKPVDHKLAKDDSANTEPVESKAPASAPIETPSSEAKAPEEESTEAKNDKNDELKAVEADATEQVSAEEKITEAKIVKTEVIEVKTESKVVESAPVEPRSVESKAPDSKPHDSKPPAPAPVGAKPVEVEEEFSDPDEDDLDDLDDMLDDFSTVKLDSQKAPAAPGPSKMETSKSPPPGKQPAVEDMFSEDDFAKQLQAGMADLLGELEKSPDMQAQFEDIFQQIAAAEGSSEPAAPSAPAKPAAEASADDESFQDTIRRTMERMQASGDQATAAAATGGGDDFMSEMLKQLSSGDLGALGGEGSEEEFSKMLMGMMEQLTNKEILYEPMKELNEKFPEWLTKNRSTTSQEDLKRYEEQQAVVREIVTKFEEKTYSDSNATDREFIVDRMQKMQAAGSPPADLVGDMPSAQEALNPGDEACNPQ